MSASPHLLGLHHITAIASDGRRNLDFYTRVLGLRFVKKTVNFDDPGTYHLYYGSHDAAPGTLLTFFLWESLPRGRNGLGMTSAIAWSVPRDALGFWRERLARLGVSTSEIPARFGDQGLAFTDPDGLPLELLATAEVDPRPAPPPGDIPAEVGLRGFHSVTLAVAAAEPTAGLLTGEMGYRPVGQEGGRARYTVDAGGPGTYVDLHVDPSLPPARSGRGTVHHVAFRAPDGAAQKDVRTSLVGHDIHVSPVMERCYFQSIYYREPAGVLFEIATDGPGFTIDEPLDQLGSRLKLPPWYEAHRAEIEARLPALG